MFTIRTILPCTWKIQSFLFLLIVVMGDRLFGQSITMTNPTLGQSFSACATLPITWNHSGTSGTFRITYNAGAGWITISNNYAAAASPATFNWSVPNLNSSNVRIEVEDATNMFVFGQSGIFSINPNVQVLSPNGGQNWVGGTTQAITYSLAGGVTNVRLEYSTDNGSTWTLITASTSGGSYNWTIPNISSNQCLIRATDLANPCNTDISDAVFTLGSSVTIVVPNGGESWNATVGPQGTAYNMDNTTVYTNTANFYDNGGIAGNAVAVNQTKTFYTDNPVNKLRVTFDSYNLSGGSLLVYDGPSTSDPLVMTISGTGSNASYTSTHYTGALTFATNAVTGPGWESRLESIGTTPRTVSWNIVGTSTHFNLLTSSNSGITWTQILTNYPSSTGTFDWQVPDVTSVAYKFKVVDYVSSSIVDETNGTFIVTPMTPTIVLYSPNGGNAFTAGSSVPISWRSSQPLPCSFVNLAYSTNGGSTWTNIAMGVTNTAFVNTYNWTVPSIASTNCLIRVEDACSPSRFDVSDAPFSVGHLITINNPLAGQVLNACQPVAIDWSFFGLSTNDFYLRANLPSLGNQPINTVPYTVPTSPGSYLWSPPNVNGPARVFVQCYTPSLYSVPSGVFTINSPFQLTAPNGGQFLPQGATYPITYTNTGPTTNALLEYTIDSGLTWVTINPNYAPTTGTFNWTVPNVSSTKCLVRMTDNTNPCYTITSDTTFTIGVASAPNISGPVNVCGTSPASYSTTNYVGATYSWTPTNGTIVSGQGTNAVSVNWTSSTGQLICSQTIGASTLHDTILVTVSPNPTVTFLPYPSSVCAPDSIQIIANSPGIVTYVWTPGMTTSNNIWISGAGTHGFSVTVANMFGCAASLNGFVTIHPSPTVNLGPDQQVCPGTNVTLNAGNPGSMYIWSTGATTQQITTNIPGQYSVTVTNANNCSSSDTVVISNIAVPSVNLGPDQTVCPGTGVVLDAGPGFNGYLWSNGATSQQITVYSPGNYSVTVTAGTSCTANDAILISHYPAVVVNLGPDQTVCPGVNANFNAGNPGAFYAWNNGMTSQQIFVSYPMLYIVTVTDNNGCADTDSVLLSNHPLWQGFLGQDTIICADTTITLSAPSGSNYLWSTAATTSSITVTQGGTYSVTLTGGPGNCQQSDTITITGLGDCVFPGDADYDGVADNNDVLALGISFGATGTTRPNASSQWYGQASNNWPLTLPGGVNYKHSDADGNGVVNANDTLPITQNYGRTHNKSNGTTGGNNIIALEALTDSVQVGDTAVFRVLLGTATQPVDSLYGLAFTVNYDTALVDSQGLLYSSYQFCWFVPAPQRLNFTYDLYPSPMADFAAVRTTGTDTLGHGEVCRFGLVTIDNISGKRNTLTKPLHVWLSDVRIITSQYEILSYAVVDDSLVVVDETASQGPGPSEVTSFEVFPNPTSGHITIRSSSAMELVEVYDLRGSRIYSSKIYSAQHTRIDAGVLPPGAYLVKALSFGQTFTKLIVVKP